MSTRDSKGRFVAGAAAKEGRASRGRLGMKVEGLKRLKKALRSKEIQYHKGIERGLKRAGLLLQRFSQQIVPVDLSILKASANTRAEGVGIDTEVFVSYGTDYAVYVHEDLGAQHAAGTQAKYLSDPATKRRDELVAVVIDSIPKR